MRPVHVFDQPSTNREHRQLPLESVLPDLRKCQRSFFDRWRFSPDKHRTIDLTMIIEMSRIASRLAFQ